MPKAKYSPCIKVCTYDEYGYLLMIEYDFNGDGDIDQTIEYGYDCEE